MRNYLYKSMQYVALAIIALSLFNSCKKESEIHVPSNEGVARINFKLSQSNHTIDTEEAKYASTNKIEELGAQVQQQIISINDEYKIIAEFIDQSKINSKAKLASTNPTIQPITDPIKYVVYVFDKLTGEYVTSFDVTNDINLGNGFALPSGREYTFIAITDMSQSSAYEVDGYDIVTQFEMGFKGTNQDLSSAVYKGRRWFINGRDIELQGVTPSIPVFYCKIDDIGQLSANQTYSLNLNFKRIPAKVNINYEFLSNGLENQLYAQAYLVSPNILLGENLDILLNSGQVDETKHDPNYNSIYRNDFSPIYPEPYSGPNYLVEFPYVGHAYLKAADPNAKLKLKISTTNQITLFDGELTNPINLVPGGDYTVNLKIQKTANEGN